jgi:hypothetical protein
MPTHPSLRSAASVTAGLGISALLLFCFVCAMATNLLADSDSMDEPVVWVVVGLILLIFLAPAITLICCVRPIGRASKAAVTVALVISSLATLGLTLTSVSYALRLLVFMRFMGRPPPFTSILPFLITTALLAGCIVNVVKLARCYRVIDEIRYGGRRGFEPLVVATGEPPPSPAQWPDITQ